MGLDDELNIARLADGNEQLGEDRLGQGVQVNLGLFQDYGATHRGEIGDDQHRQYLRNTYTDVP